MTDTYQPKNSNVPQRGGKSEKELFGLYLGIVKDTSDIDRMGRILAYIPELGGREEDSLCWRTISYSTPFAGSTPIDNIRDNSDKFEHSQVSYGMWFPNPDVGNKILVMFMNGRSNRGICIGSMYQQNMNHMVPGLPGARHSGDTTSFVPTGEYNKKSVNDPNNTPRPIYTPLNDGLTRQGLQKDYIRGVTTSGARRQITSTTYGVSTPRGSQFVMDDGFLNDEIGDNVTVTAEANPALQSGAGGRNDEFIRLRTRSGAQIMVNETFGMVYLISRDGNNWVEMANDGHIDVYAEDDVSIHTKKSINLYADEDINLEAGRNINMKTNGGTVEHPERGTGNIYIESSANTHLTSHGSTFSSVTGNHHLSVTGNFDLLTGGSIKEKAGSTFSVQAVGDYAEDAPNIWMNSGNSLTANPTTATTPITYDLAVLDGNTIVKSSITDRVPEHEPWAGHTSRVNTLTEPVYKGELTPAATTSVGVEEALTAPPISSRGIPSTTEVSNLDFQIIRDNISDASNIQLTGERSITSLYTSDSGRLALLAEEQFYPYEYFDYKGFSIGYGHLQSGSGATGTDSRFVNGLTEEEAYNLFATDITKYENVVKRKITTRISQEQFDALVMLSYNVGSPGTNLARAINAGDMDTAVDIWLTYVNVNGVPNAALLKRREKEAVLFKQGKYPTTKSRDDHKEVAINTTLRKWKAEDLEPRRGYKTTNRQILQAFNAYNRMTGIDLPSNSDIGKTGINGFSDTYVAKV